MKQHSVNTFPPVTHQGLRVALHDVIICLVNTMSVLCLQPELTYNCIVSRIQSRELTS